MIFSISFGYDGVKKIENYTQEQYAELRKIVTGLPRDKTNMWSHTMVTVDAEGLQAIFDMGIGEVELSNFKNTYSPFRNITGGEIINDKTVLDKVTHIHIPNMGLLTINEVSLLNDGCTNQLQDMLNDGWRLLAICPPNGTRRPDYILGRSK